MEKIVIFHHVSNIGGGTISLVDVCKMLSAEYEVVVVIPRKNSQELTARLIPFAKVKHFNGTMPQISYYSGSNALLSRGFFSSCFVPKNEIREIVSMIEEEAPDLVLANSMIQCRMGKYLKHLSAKKLIYIRETFRENAVSRFMIRLMNRYFDGVLCIAPYEKEYGNFSIPCEVVADCYDIPNPVIVSPVKDDKFTALFLGGDSPIKGLDVLLKAIPYCSKNIHYQVCGNVRTTPASFKERLLHPKMALRAKCIAVSLKKYADRVQCLGYVSDTESVIRSCNVVVFPSTVPHQSRPALEAGAFGKPAILSDFKQTQCFFKDGYNCLTFRPRSPKALANALQRLADDSGLQETLGKNNYDAYVRLHNAQEEKSKLLNFVAKFLKED